MGGADGWFICRVGFVETTRAVALTWDRRLHGAARAEGLGLLPTSLD